MSNQVARVRRRRRDHSPEFKRELVARSLLPNASVASIPLEAGINANLLFTWRRAHLDALQAAVSPSVSHAVLVPVKLESSSEAQSRGYQSRSQALQCNTDCPAAKTRDHVAGADSAPARPAPLFTYDAMKRQQSMDAINGAVGISGDHKLAYGKDGNCIADTARARGSPTVQVTRTQPPASASWPPGLRRSWRRWPGPSRAAAGRRSRRRGSGPRHRRRPVRWRCDG